MATVKPFAALRPKIDEAPQICELPYDVMSADEAREMAAGNSISFLHVSRPEIDLPDDADPYGDDTYAKGAENFKRLIDDGHLIQDAKPCFYLYRQIMGDHSQVGLVAVASCGEYLNNTIKKHEFTRPDKENDRVRHVEALNSQTGPVFLTYRAEAGLDEIFDKITGGAPDIDFTAGDRVRHSSWRIDDDAMIAAIESKFTAIQTLYIADGHHRSAAAGRVFESRNGSGGSGAFLTVIFPHNQMQILAYNRALKSLGGLSPEEFLQKLDAVFTVEPSDSAVDPQDKHRLGLYLAGSWRLLTFRPELIASPDPIERLDVSLLQKQVLQPMLGIEDPRTSKDIGFIGGIRGTKELEKLVDSGEFACAFSMCATSIEDLMSVADADGIMPPKSTWFEPKVRDAMFSHLI